MSSVAVVLGTYNRLTLLKQAIFSIHCAISDHFYSIIVIDGGSTDGTLEWLDSQPFLGNHLVVIRQTELTGAVKAFNLGFEYAVKMEFDYVAHLNDDAVIETPWAIDEAIEILEGNQKIGEVAFAFDLRGSHDFEHINGVPYANFGIIRRQAGIEVAKAQGDPEGKKWWSEEFHTYAADTQFGIWLWKLGWRVHCAPKLKVHDLRCDDGLRALNSGERQGKDAELFWSRWRNEDLVKYLELNK